LGLLELDSVLDVVGGLGNVVMLAAMLCLESLVSPLNYLSLESFDSSKGRRGGVIGGMVAICLEANNE